MDDRELPTPMAGCDGKWLREERPTQPMHTTKVLVLDTATSAGVDQVVAGIGHQVATELQQPILRRRPGPGRLRVFGGTWTDVGAVDLRAHVRTRPIVSGSSVDQIVAQLVAHPLDRCRPLWDLTVLVDGEDAVAVVFRMHHALGDGMVLSRLLSDLFGDRPPDRPVPVPDAPAWSISWLPGLIADSVRSSARVRTALRKPDVVHPPAPFSGPRVGWNRRLSADRVVASSSLALADIQAARADRRFTVGEVLLAVVAGALRRYLLRHAGLPDRALVASVAVSLWPPDTTPSIGNQIGGVLADLATNEADPVRRQQQIRDSVRSARAVRSASDLNLLTRWWDFHPLIYLPQRAAVALGGRGWLGPAANVNISSIRGPSGLLRCGPAAVTEIRSVGILNDDLGLNIIAWTYRERVTITLAACPQGLPDVASLAAELIPSLDELIRAAGGR